MKKGLSRFFFYILTRKITINNLANLKKMASTFITFVPKVLTKRVAPPQSKPNVKRIHEEPNIDNIELVETIVTLNGIEARLTKDPIFVFKFLGSIHRPEGGSIHRPEGGSIHQELIIDWKNKQKMAFDISMKEGVLPIFVKDVTVNGQKNYAALSYKAFHAHLCATNKRERTFYELICAFQCHLFFDVEADYTLNPGIKEKVPELRRDLIGYIKKVLHMIGIFTKDTNPIILIVDSSNDKKWSHHIVVKLPPLSLKEENLFEIVRPHFKNLYHCGAFVRRLRNYIQETEGIDPEKNRFWVKKLEDEKVVFDFICDIIYTNHRVFRPPFATKFLRANETPRPFIPISEEGIPLFSTPEEMTWQQYTEYLVQSDWRPNIPIVECLEIDNTEPRSSNDKKTYRLDLPSMIKKTLPIDRSQIRDYYKEQFPFEIVWKMLGDKNREFSFVVNPGIFQRYQYFNSAQEFRAAILRILPLRIDVGAIYKGRMKVGEAAGHLDKYVKETPLKFDIDLDSYVDLRSSTKTPKGGLCNCESQKKYCQKCWPLVDVARRVILHYLCKEYGIPLEYIYVFSSGGRGIHIWVLSCLSQKVDVANGANGMNGTKVANLTSFQRKILTQRILNGKNARNHLKEIAKTFKKAELRTICSGLHTFLQKGTKCEMLALLWPRIDIAPTVGLSHIMRCPYSYRHDTKNIVSPFLLSEKEKEREKT